MTEFRRIVSVDLKKTFFDRLDEYVPRFLRLYRARDNPVKELQDLLQSLDEDVSSFPSSLSNSKLSLLLEKISCNPYEDSA